MPPRRHHDLVFFDQALACTQAVPRPPLFAMGSGRLQTGMSLTRRRPARRPTDGSVPALDVERTVYLEYAWKPHSAYEVLTREPPSGYRFISASGVESKLFKTLSRATVAYSLLYLADRLVPVHLMKSYWSALRTPARPAVALTYAVNHLVLRDEPWILDLPSEHISNVLGGFRHFKRLRGFTQRKLSSGNCRAIIVSIEASRKALGAALGEHVAQKARLVPWAVPAKKFRKNFDSPGVKLLFVNSANILGQFDAKGGKEALEAFALLRQRYPDLEMVLRSDLPATLKRRFEGARGLKIIDRPVAWPVLEREFLTADIFVLPTHLTPLAVFLDAMSYELPVVTTDAWGNCEIVEDGVTGLVSQDWAVGSFKEQMLPRYFVPPAGTPEYDAIITSTDERTVAGLVKNIGRLIEDSELRCRLGRAGREAVESGRFSMQGRNATLKRVLDEAMGLADADE